MFPKVLLNFHKTLLCETNIICPHFLQKKELRLRDLKQLVNGRAQGQNVAVLGFSCSGAFRHGMGLPA